MALNSIYDTDDLPDRRLRFTQLFHSNSRDLGEQMVRSRQDIVRRLAHKIGEDDKFIRVVPDDGVFVSLVADVIVLTTDEYLGICREQFMKGMRHAAHFYPIEVGPRG